MNQVTKRLRSSGSQEHTHERGYDQTTERTVQTSSRLHSATKPPQRRCPESNVCRYGRDTVSLRRRIVVYRCYQMRRNTIINLQRSVISFTNPRHNARHNLLMVAPRRSDGVLTVHSGAFAGLRPLAHAHPVQNVRTKREYKIVD